MIDFESESRLADSLLRSCIEKVTKDNSEIEKALRSPGVVVAIAKLHSVTTEETKELLYCNIFRLGAMVALSIRDVESIK